MYEYALIANKILPTDGN